MAVSSTVTLPQQAAVGQGTLYTPFGGDGKSAPLGIYDVDIRVVGDAGGGNAGVTIAFDPRYTSVIAYVLAYVIADTAAGDFQLAIEDSVQALPNTRIVGTLPGVAEAFQAQNSIYMWYPPPIWLDGNGTVSASYVNVDATETYGMSVQMYVFDRNVRQIEAAQFLNMVRIGNNAPVAS